MLVDNVFYFFLGFFVNFPFLFISTAVLILIIVSFLIGRKTAK